MVYLVAGIGAVLLLWALVWVGINAAASTVARWAKWIIVAALVCGAVALLASGQFRHALMPAFLLFPVLFPWSRTRWRRGMGGGRQGGFGGGGPAGAGSSMTYKEAAEILGVAPDASDEEIKAAHRELMSRNHPDKGGSPWFARRLNEARDVLLGGKR